MVLDTQCDVNGVLRCGNRPPTARMGERLRTENRSSRRIDPIGTVSAARQVENQTFLVGSGHDLVNVWFQLAVVMVEGILFSALTDAPVVTAGGHAANDKAAIWPHL